MHTFWFWVISYFSLKDLKDLRQVAHHHHVTFHLRLDEFCFIVILMMALLLTMALSAPFPLWVLEEVHSTQSNQAVQFDIANR